MLEGSYVALVTPMTPTGEIDFVALDALLDWHIEDKTDGLVILGTTGEAATITQEERDHILNHVISRVSGRMPVWVGTGTNATASTIEMTQHAQRCGASGALVVTPFYNRPTQEGLFEHYKSVAAAVDLPIMLYNVPSRTSIDLLPDTVCRLSHIENIVALKDATGDLSRLPELLSTGLSCFSGDDGSACAFVSEGGHGVVSVVANVRPFQMRQMIHAARKGLGEANDYNDALMPWFDALSVETNPIPVKWCLAEMGKIDTGLRLPLLPLSRSGQRHVMSCVDDLLVAL